MDEETYAPRNLICAFNKAIVIKEVLLKIINCEMNICMYICYSHSILFGAVASIECLLLSK
jgi:hypothetical protein